MTTPQTPFPTTGYYGPEYFCNRHAELDQLIRNCKGGNSTTLIALRRLGKTALIRHLFHQLRNRYVTIYLDILPTESLIGLLNQLSTAIVSQYSERTTIGKKTWAMIKSLRPTISYDPLSGSPLVSIMSTPEASRQSIGELFSLLENHTKPVVIAIDEFQQILDYPEKNTDAWLRSLVQKLNNVVFIFSGSHQHLMKELFSNPARPFFRSTQFLKLGKLDEQVYGEFIQRQFTRHTKLIDKETITEMMHWADTHTYYVQLLCNRVFLLSEKTIKMELWKEEAAKILKEQEFVFFGYREMLTKPQWELLKAIALEDKVYQPTSSEFIMKYLLGNASTVNRSLKSLEKMELVYRENDEKGKGYYGIYDVLFKRWVERQV